MNGSNSNSNQESENTLEVLASAGIYANYKKQHPNLYRAWRSMCANNSVEVITPTWRGQNGFITFCMDAGILLNAPIDTDKSPMKLKRWNDSLAFSLHNVYWKLPKNLCKAEKVVSLDVESLTSKYPTQEDIEMRINTLFNLSLEKHLSQDEQLELDILTHYLTTGEINVPIKETLTKHTDI